MSVPHIPTAAQLTQLAVLQAVENSTSATLAAITSSKTLAGSLHTARTAFLNAQNATAMYANYIYGGGPKSTVIDEGGQSTV